MAESVLSKTKRKGKTSKKNITACLVVHNEEKVIARALKSCRSLVDDIWVIHDGPCNDKTVSICKRYGAKVLIRPHVGIAEPHRVWFLSHVQTDWILQLDADEFLSSRLQKALPQLVLSSDIACYSFIWPYWKNGKYVTHTWPLKKALFHKKKVHFLGFPQEEVRPTGPVQQTDLILEHQPNYDNYTSKSFNTKWASWIDIHTRYFLSNYKKLARYPANDYSLEPHYAYLVDAPLKNMLVLPPYHFLGSWLLGGWREGVSGVVISFMTAYYYFCICAKVMKVQSSHA